ncbi:lithostathine-2-like [Bactrocera neohumeralis]|uniref:lithostathine-2-like n=1 Tax=Bactrocera neohumeralis TaxID=98809 RepID=UPI002165FD9F|nr:lithostathine-2-like [Bactrocera neohumeralis]
MKRLNTIKLSLFLAFFVAFLLFEETQSAVIDLENIILNKTEAGYNDSKAENRAVAATDDDFYVSEDAISWFAAEYFCRKNGWHLVSIRNLEEAVQLNGFLHFNTLTVERYWTSGNRLADQKSWYWDLNYEGMGYTNWAENEPETTKAQYCMRLTGMLWYSYDCVQSSRYICRKH